MAVPVIEDGASYFAPDFTEGKLYDLRVSQWMWFFAWFFYGLVGIFAIPTLWVSVPFAAISLMIGAFGAWTYDEGAGYQIFADHRTSGAMTKRGLDEADGTSIAGENNVDLNLSLAGIPLGIESATSPCARDIGHVLPTGFIINGELSRIAFVVRYGSSQRPALDWNRRMEAEQRIVDVIAEAAASVDHDREHLSLGHSITMRPVNMQHTLDLLANDTLHFDFVRPKPGTPEAKMTSVLQERLKKVGTKSNDTVNTYAVTIDLSDVWARQMRAGEKLERIDESSLFMLVNHIVHGLRQAGQPNAEALNLLELDEWIRIVRTINGAGKLHSSLYERRKRFKKMTMEDVIEDLANGSPWPFEFVKLGRDFLYMDGSYFRIWRTIRFEGSKRFRPGGMLGLQFPKTPHESRWNTTTLVGSIRSAVAEEAKMTRMIVWSEAARDADKERGKYQSARDKDVRGRPGEQQTRLYRQGAPVFKFNRYTVVAAPNRMTLRMYTTATLAAHAFRSVKLRLITLPVRQIRAFTVALLGIDM